MRPLPLALLLFAYGCSNALAPSEQGRFAFPPELAPVIDHIDADPWIHPLIGKPAGVWMRQHLRGIRMDPSRVGGAVYEYKTGWVLWTPTDLPGTIEIDILASIVLHEARHGAGWRHTCRDTRGDRTMEEGGAQALQILWLERNGPHHWATYLRETRIGCY